MRINNLLLLICIATSITYTGNHGGIFGSSSVDPVNSFWDVTSSGVSTSKDASNLDTTVGGLTTAQMKTSSTYSTWDRTIWNISNGEYPTLK